MAGRGLKHEDPLSLEMFYLDELSREVGFESDEDALLDDLPSERDLAVRHEREIYGDRKPARSTPKDRVDDFYERKVVPLSDDEFRQQFRMNRQTVDTIVDALGEREASTALGVEYCLRQPRHKQLLLFLRYMGNSSLSLRRVAELFEISFSTTHYYADEIASKLTELCPMFIQMPTGERRLKAMRLFEQTCGVRRMAGAISDCHIPIKKPDYSDPDRFRNRRGYHSIHLLSVADTEGRFTAVEVGWPGSLAEADVLLKSRLCEQLSDHATREHFLPNHSFLVGGDTLPLRPWLMTPFSRDHLLRTDRRIQHYNAVMTEATLLTQRAVGVMRARFPRLAFVEAKAIKKAVQLVTAACVLHNLCILLGDRWGQEVEEEVDPSVQEEPASTPVSVESNQRRNRLVTQLWEDAIGGHYQYHYVQTR